MNTLDSTLTGRGGPQRRISACLSLTLAGLLLNLPGRSQAQVVSLPSGPTQSCPDQSLKADDIDWTHPFGMFPREFIQNALRSGDPHPAIASLQQSIQVLSTLGKGATYDLVVNLAAQSPPSTLDRIRQAAQNDPAAVDAMVPVSIKARSRS